MPDITMCNGETCALSETCYRAPQSGTVPNGRNQSWFIEEPYWRDCRGPTVCDYYWKILLKRCLNTTGNAPQQTGLGRS